jgi:hypothetical protein
VADTIKTPAARRGEAVPPAVAQRASAVVMLTYLFALLWAEAFFGIFMSPVVQAPLSDYQRHSKISMAGVVPSQINCCGGRCGDISPIEMDVAELFCKGIQGCWGFSYDTDTKIASFKAAHTASVDSYVTASGFRKADSNGFRSFRYSNVGAVFNITKTHTYQGVRTVDTCARACDEEDVCNVFEIEYADSWN